MKATKYIIGIVMLVIVGYNSVYFKKLDEVKASKATTEFNPSQYARTFWNDKLKPGLSKAIDIVQLTSLLSVEPEKTFDTFSHVLGIGNLRYFLIRGEGIITSIQEDDVSVSILDSNQRVTIATEYIFGNAVRDATGLININEFSNTMDFNNVSAEINKIIREQVLPSFKSNIKKGDKIEFIGAIELNKEHLNVSRIEVLPIEIKVL